jgi:ATP-dependent Clp protease ATP-binding subunit ClpX
LGTSQEQFFSKEPLEDPLNLLEPQDLIKFGLIPEFVGRLPIFTHSRQLTIDEMVEAMTIPKNSIVDQYTRMLRMSGVGAPG